MKLSDFRFISKHQAAELLGISVSTLNRWRKSPETRGWIQDVHFTLRDSGEWEYNEYVLQAWKNRRIAPHAYINALQSFQQAVEVGDRKRRKVS